MCVVSSVIVSEGKKDLGNGKSAPARGGGGKQSSARSVYSKTQIRPVSLGQGSDGFVSFQDYSYSPDTRYPFDGWLDQRVRPSS